MSKKMWGGRFRKQIDKDFDVFQKSIHYDYRLAEYDIYHSIIHINALAGAKVLTLKETKQLRCALLGILKEIREGKFKPDFNCEDIHTDIQNKVEQRAGKVAMKLHSLRSRNDQVAFDEKWYCFKQALEIEKMLFSLRGSLLFFAIKYKKQPVIGYTHTQRAQVISFTDYLLAFCEMFKRDAGRMKRFYDNLFAYIGAGALAGSSLKRRDYDNAIAEFSKMKLAPADKVKLTKNTLDNVSDRDFIIEFLSILSIIQMHLSRMAEDFILYSTEEFNFVDLPEAFCTGSSLMPHKKNPDFLELVRGYTGRIYGGLVSVLTTMKGLPLTYNRDMQLDKEPLFSCVETIKDELKIMAKLLTTAELNSQVVRQALKDKALYATELADWLMRKHRVPFKQAHDIVGRLVSYAVGKGKAKEIDQIGTDKLKDFHPALSVDIIKKIMNSTHALNSKRSFSGKLSKKNILRNSSDARI